MLAYMYIPPPDPYAAWQAIGLIAATLLGLLVGLPLLWFGRRGRVVDDHPHCRRCGFDLFGTPAATTRCGECGADLLEPRAVRIGERRRRPVMLLAGLVLLAVAGSFGRRAWQRDLSAIDWQTLKPTTWLIDSLGDADPIVSRHATRILSDRWRTDALTPNQRSAAVSRVLTLPPGSDRAARFKWDEWVLALKGDGALSVDEQAAFLKRVIPIKRKLVLRPHVRRGDPLPLWIDNGVAQVTSYVGEQIVFRTIGNDRLTVDGRPVPVSEVAAADQIQSISERHDATRLADLSGLTDLKPGRHVARLVGRRRVEWKTGGGPDPGVEIDIDVSRSFDLLPDDRSGVVLLHDAETLKTAWQSIGVPWRISSGNGQIFVESFSPQAAGTDLAYDVVLRAGGQEWSLGSYVAVRGSEPMPWRWDQLFNVDLPDTTREADLILRPSVQAAVRTVNVMTVADHPIEFRHVPVRHGKSLLPKPNLYFP